MSENMCASADFVERTALDGGHLAQVLSTVGLAEEQECLAAAAGFHERAACLRELDAEALAQLGLLFYELGHASAVTVIVEQSDDVHVVNGGVPGGVFGAGQDPMVGMELGLGGPVIALENSEVAMGRVLLALTKIERSLEREFESLHDSPWEPRPKWRPHRY